MSIQGVGNGIRSRIIVELLSPGEYILESGYIHPGQKKKSCFPLKMNVQGVGNGIRSRIIVELLSPGEYIPESGYIHLGYRKSCFPLKISVQGVGNGIRSRIIVKLLSPGEYLCNSNPYVHFKRSTPVPLKNDIRLENYFSMLDLVMQTYGAIHTSQLDRSEIDLSPKRSECECELRSIQDRSK